jgi:hypothetical protein
MKSRRTGIVVSAVGAALMAIAMFAPSAFADTPKAGYERFAGCPSPKENPEVFLCQLVTIDGGHFQMGNKDVPITNPMKLSGGLLLSGKIAASAKGGLTPVRQTVPGGIIGLTGLDWLINFLNLEGLKLYAVTELAGVPSAREAGVEVDLPIRVHLENPVLGNNCYVGSFTNPIVLHLTMGTTKPPAPNKPISGTFPTEVESGQEGVGKLIDGVYVDNSFAAPGASGCVLTLFGFIPISINGLVNSTSGLPAAAGTNETKQNFDLEVADPYVVYP